MAKFLNVGTSFRCPLYCVDGCIKSCNGIVFGKFFDQHQCTIANSMDVNQILNAIRRIHKPETNRLDFNETTSAENTAVISGEKYFPEIVDLSSPSVTSNFNLSPTNVTQAKANITLSDIKYQYEPHLFLDPEDDLICPICLNILNIPFQCLEGHMYCYQCILQLIPDKKSKNVCPCCKIAICWKSLGKNLLAKRTINKMLIYCPTSSDIDKSVKHCTWIGQLDASESHCRKDCEFVEVNCPSPGCEVRLLRHELNGHLNQTCVFNLQSCVFCKLHIPLCHFDVHQIVCEMKPVVCRNVACGAVMPYCALKHHLTVCYYEVVECPLSQMGLCDRNICSGHVIRCDLETHLSAVSNPKIVLALLNTIREFFVPIQIESSMVVPEEVNFDQSFGVIRNPHMVSVVAKMSSESKASVVARNYTGRAAHFAYLQSFCQLFSTRDDKCMSGSTRTLLLDWFANHTPCKLSGLMFNEFTQTIEQFGSYVVLHAFEFDWKAIMSKASLSDDSVMFSDESDMLCGSKLKICIAIYPDRLNNIEIMYKCCEGNLQKYSTYLMVLSPNSVKGCRSLNGRNEEHKPHVFTINTSELQNRVGQSTVNASKKTVLRIALAAYHV